MRGRRTGCADDRCRRCSRHCSGCRQRVVNQPSPGPVNRSRNGTIPSSAESHRPLSRQIAGCWVCGERPTGEKSGWGAHLPTARPGPVPPIATGSAGRRRRSDAGSTEHNWVERPDRRPAGSSSANGSADRTTNKPVRRTGPRSASKSLTVDDEVTRAAMSDLATTRVASARWPVNRGALRLLRNRSVTRLMTGLL